MVHHRWLRSSVASILILGLALPAWGQTSQQTIVQLRAQIEQLEQKVDAIQREQEQHTDQLGHQVQVLSQQEAVVQAAQKAQRQSVFKEPSVRLEQSGFWVRGPQPQEYSLHIGGYMQVDGRFYTSQDKTTGSSNPSAPSEFLIRQVRPFFEGVVDKYYDYKIMLDFGQGTTTLEDAYAGVDYFPEARVRLGKFKEPVGLELLQDSRYTEFVELGYPSELVPNRDIGVTLWSGSALHNRLTYNLGVFNGGADNTASVDLDTNNAKDFTGRLFFQPFMDSPNRYLQGIGAGFAGTYGPQRGSTIVDSYKSPFQNVIFKYNSTVQADGDRYRWTPQFFYYHGPLGLMGEFVENWQQLKGPVTIKQGTSTKSIQVAEPISNQAWELTATYVLTGENATYTGVIPRYNFDPRQGHYGAFEVAGRLEQLLIDRDAFTWASPAINAREALTWILGVNWYLSSNFKIMVDWVQTDFSGGGVNLGDRKTESGFMTETEIMF